MGARMCVKMWARECRVCGDGWPSGWLDSGALMCEFGGCGRM